MRIAIIDLLFSWPPHGGADVDVYHVAQGLCAQGHETHLIFVRDALTWERGQADVGVLPFSTECLAFSAGALTEAALTARVRQAVKNYRPDFVFLTQAYFFKVPLILALKDFRVISRCYAHETACHRDILRFKDEKPCPNEYRRTPDICRRCALESQRNTIVQGHHTAWTQEYVETCAWSRNFYDKFLAAMYSLHAVVITTEQMRDQVSGLCDRIHVIPHGVDTNRFTPAEKDTERNVPIIFSPGRMEDPAKGMQVLMDAATMLASEGRTFEVHATLPEGYGGPPWLKAIGKIAHEDMPHVYQQADICVVPSVWDEPFGIVALEAMASGLPVCATRAGGLQDIIVHEKTGLLFDRGNAASLAEGLRKMLEDDTLRRTMGMAGRSRVVDNYRWESILEYFYPLLFHD